ncbi:hypothetical protein EDD16DRAFT_780438 [Pisolithus croceorrhizus]|nr:hypothetical protein EV401DRAFT_580784 [Pisolithus croceorrhizus]KAI6122351.1 hypothetical protein EDD16DRAFT_780438 [Pisolithus croceorrhizus]KAI6142321.1 hypothetical protein EDD17DRAFT_242588 [Pisolithus thermaeus]
MKEKKTRKHTGDTGLSHSTCFVSAHETETRELSNLVSLGTRRYSDNRGKQRKEDHITLTYTHAPSCPLQKPRCVGAKGFCRSFFFFFPTDPVATSLMCAFEPLQRNYDTVLTFDAIAIRGNPEEKTSSPVHVGHLSESMPSSDLRGWLRRDLFYVLTNWHPLTPNSAFHFFKSATPPLHLRHGHPPSTRISGRVSQSTTG